MATVVAEGAGSHTQYSMTVPKPGGLANGDIVIVIGAGNRFLFEDGPGGSSYPAGFTRLYRWVSSGSGHQWYTNVYYKVITNAGGEPANWQWLHNNASPNDPELSGCTYLVLRGISASNPIAASNYQNSYTSPAVTVPEGGTLVTWHGVQVGMYGAGTMDMTPPAGMVEAGSANDSFGSYNMASSQELNYILAAATGSSGSRTPTLVPTSTISAYEQPVSVALALNRLNTAPTAPTLGSPAAGATVDASGGITFSWTHNDPEGDAQNGYSLRRRIQGSGTWYYWTGSAWTTTQTWVTSGTASVAIPASHWVDGEVYEWSVATRDPGTLTGPYATERVFTVQDANPTASLIAPANQAAVALTSGVTLQWSFNDPNDTQSAYALRRRTWASGTWEWWNAGTSTWQGTEVYNTTASQSVTIGGAYWPAIDTTYYWSVSVKDASGDASIYTTDFVVNPWEVWNGSAWVVTESPSFIVSASTSVQAPKAAFISGTSYGWAVKVKDAASQEGPWATQTDFTFGGAVPREGWGTVLI
jgi:hypothetical protein